MVDADELRRMLSAFGEVRTQDVGAWRGPFPLPEPLAAFYRDVGPVSLEIDGYGNGFHVPALDALWDLQAGYRANARTGQPQPDWDDDWLVVADQGGDPFVSSRAHGTVSFAAHGAGRWRFRTVFPHILAMAAGLGAIGSIVREAGEDLTDEDSLIRAAHRTTLERAVSPFLAADITPGEFVEALGW